MFICAKLRDWGIEGLKDKIMPNLGIGELKDKINNLK
jgi:hypothetical protein